LISVIEVGDLAGAVVDAPLPHAYSNMLKERIQTVVGVKIPREQAVFMQKGRAGIMNAIAFA
jgi:hypothetical protein